MNYGDLDERVRNALYVRPFHRDPLAIAAVYIAGISTGLVIGWMFS